ALPSGPKEEARISALQHKDVADEPDKEIADVPGGSSLHDKAPLKIVGITEEPDTAPADRNALSEGRERERSKLPPALRRHDHVTGVSARYERGKGRLPIRRTGRRDRPGGIADRKDMRM